VGGHENPPTIKCETASVGFVDGSATRSAGDIDLIVEQRIINGDLNGVDSYNRPLTQTLVVGKQVSGKCRICTHHTSRAFF
jgi:hypothetical protein